MNVVMLWLRVAAGCLFGCLVVRDWGSCSGGFWAISAALDGWEVVVAVWYFGW